MANWAPDSTRALTVKGVREAQAFTGLVVDIWQIERERLTIWSPLLLVLGIWTYFALPREPPLALSLILTLLVGYFMMRPANRAWTVLAILLLGFAAAAFNTYRVATPLLRAFTPDVELTGHVRDIERRGTSRGHIVLDVLAAPTLPEGERPRRVRLQVSLGPEATPQVGDLIRLRASLAPLPRPLRPGGFDYGRQLFFEGIGATGRSIRPPEIIVAEVPLRHLLRRGFHNARGAIGARVRAAIKGPLGSFAEALITGERAAIPRPMNESLQASGLFHVLSISGLHMSLVAGGVFWFMRAMLAAIPSLALRQPIKKWAAGAAILFGALYMMLADSGAATERAFIMIAIVFFAIIVDRPAISMHNLAVAAIIILLVDPAQALSASFQMSFMAVMGLAAAFPHFDKLAERLRTQAPAGFLSRWGRRGLVLLLASIATSLIAGSLSAIPAAHHFGRLAPFGVIANALALPVVGLVVMPAALASVVLMPLGLEALPLAAMEQGLSLVMVVSDWVATWSGSASRLPLLGAGPAVLLALAAALLCLSASALRLAALPFMLAAVLMPASTEPLLRVDERGSNVGLATDQGWVPAVAKGASFSVRRWMEDDGDMATVVVAARRPGWRCDAKLCQANSRGVEIAYLRRAAEAERRCPKADVLVAEFPLRNRCRGKMGTIDRFAVWREGAHDIHLSEGEIRVLTVRTAQGERPWTYESRARAMLSRKSP